MITASGELSVPEHMALLRVATACPHRGKVVDTGEGCACPPTHLCSRDWRVVDVDDCLACVRRGRPAAALPATLPPAAGPPSRLVVARYAEDLAWLAGAPAGAEVVVYNKGAPLPGAGAVPLPNVGREGHAFLWHVVAHYHGLAGVTFFLQGDAPHHSPDVLGRLRWSPPPTVVTPLSDRYTAEFPPAWQTAHDLVTTNADGRRIRLGHGHWFGVDPSRAWFERHWAGVFAGPPPEAPRYAYTAMLAVPREVILARPLADWAWLLASMGGAAGYARAGAEWGLNPWAFEALCWYVFDPSWPLLPADRRAPR